MATVKESVSAKGKNKGTSKALAKPKARPPQDERYDWSRTQGPNPEDVRTLGAPCFGEHIEAVPTRGRVGFASPTLQRGDHRQLHEQPVLWLQT